jgi:hypothetical protein
MPLLQLLPFRPLHKRFSAQGYTYTGGPPFSLGGGARQQYKNKAYILSFALT